MCTRSVCHCQSRLALGWLCRKVQQAHPTLLLSLPSFLWQLSCTKVWATSVCENTQMTMQQYETESYLESGTSWDGSVECMWCFFSFQCSQKYHILNHNWLNFKSYSELFLFSLLFISLFNCKGMLRWGSCVTNTLKMGELSQKRWLKGTKKAAGGSRATDQLEASLAAGHHFSGQPSAKGITLVAAHQIVHNSLP